MSLGIPIKVLHEAEGHIITCESSTGEVYRGKLVEAEEHMNLQVMLTLSGQRYSRPQRSKIDKVYCTLCTGQSEFTLFRFYR